MVSNTKIALRVLHEVLVAARNIGIEQPGNSAVTDIVDSVEAVPLWIADDEHDHTLDLIQVVVALAARYPECRIAASMATELRRT